MNRIVRGALAGVAATGPMSLVMAAANAAGWLGMQPPKHITARAEEEAGVRQQISYPVFQSSWMLAHAGYGAAMGALYGLVRRELPLPAAVAGLSFGGLVWAVSYLGVMPGLNLYPWPSEDSPSRMSTMIAAHAVYGLTLGKVDRLLGEG